MSLLLELNNFTYYCSSSADPNTLLNTVPNINCSIRNEKTTAFMFAATKGYLNLIDTMLKFNKNVNVKDSLGRNAIFYAILAEKGDNADIIQRLILEGIQYNEADNNEGNTPLMIATNKNLKDTVKTLLEFKANPNIQNLQGNTALHLAILAKSPDIVKLLLAHKADLYVKNKDKLNPLDLAAKMSRTDIYNMVVEEKNSREMQELNSLKDLEHENTTGTSKVSNSKKKNTKQTESITNSQDNQGVQSEGGDSNEKDKEKIISPNKIISTNFGLLASQAAKDESLNLNNLPNQNFQNPNFMINNQNLFLQGQNQVRNQGEEYISMNSSLNTMNTINPNNTGNNIYLD